MNPKFADDRLSAYVDGTLSAAEAAELRREIDRSSELAALVTELRQVRSEVQSLPRVKAPEGFAARVMAKVAEAQREAAVVVPASSQKQGNNWASFAWGAVAASLVLVALSFVLPRGSNEVAINNVPNPAISPPPGKTKQTRAFDLVNLGEAMAHATTNEEMYVARLTVRNSALLQGTLERSLTTNGVTVAGSLENETALSTAAKAYSLTSEEPRAVREVLYLVGTDQQVRDALKSLTNQPMDVANLQDKVLAVPAGNLLADATEVTSQAQGMAVRIGQKQLYKSLGKEIGEGEGNADPNASSDVLIVIRIVK